MKTANKPIMVKNGLTESEDFSLSLRKLQNNVPLHWHGYYELEFVISGNGKQIINGKSVDISRGCLTFLDPFDCHCIVPDDKIILFNCSFKDTFIFDDSMRINLLKKSQSFCNIEDVEKEIFEQLFIVCINEAKLKGSQDIQVLVNCLIKKALRYMSKNPNIISNASSSKIRSALLYINTHFRSSPTLTETARAVNLNSSYLSSIFHKEMKISYNKYLTQLKIGYAKELLLSTDLSVENVCYECGYGSYPGFLQAFRKLTNMSPCKLKGKSSLKKH